MRKLWDCAGFWVKPDFKLFKSKLESLLNSWMWLDLNIQRSSHFQAGHRWTLQRCKRYRTVYIHPQESHLWTCLGNKQINQCQLELRLKQTTSWESDTRSALNSRQCNYAAKPFKVLRVWEDELVHIKGSHCLLSIPLSGTLLSRDFSMSMRQESCSGSPLFHVFHVLIRTLPDTTVWEAILHKYTDLQNPFPAPLHCSCSHVDTSLLRWGQHEL